MKFVNKRAVFYRFWFNFKFFISKYFEVQENYGECEVQNSDKRLMTKILQRFYTF